MTTNALAEAVITINSNLKNATARHLLTRDIGPLNPYAAPHAKARLDALIGLSDALGASIRKWGVRV